jgi:AcrR family transcriptional regulator
MASTAASTPRSREPARRRTRSWGKHDRQKFLDVASKLFARDGYAEVSLEDIAASIDARKGSMSYYWRRKEDFLLEIVRRFSGSIQTELQDISARDSSATERLRAAIDRHVNSILSSRTYATIFFEQRRHLPRKEQRAMSRFDSMIVDVYRRIIEDGVKAGEFKAFDAGIVTMELLGLMNWTYRWFQEDGPVKREDLVAEITASALRILQAGV